MLKMRKSAPQFQLRTIVIDNTWLDSSSANANMT